MPFSTTQKQAAGAPGTNKSFTLDVIFEQRYPLSSSPELSLRTVLDDPSDPTAVTITVTAEGAEGADAWFLAWPHGDPSASPTQIGPYTTVGADGEASVTVPWPSDEKDVAARVADGVFGAFGWPYGKAKVTIGGGGGVGDGSGNNDATSGSTGDPHIISLDGLRYNFQGAGEFILVGPRQRFLESPVEPGAGEAPLALDGRQRHPHHLGDLGMAQAAEETQLHQPALVGIARGQTPHGIVELQDVERRLDAGRESVVEGDRPLPAAALLVAVTAGVVDQQSAHRLGGDGVEMRPAVPAHPGLVDQAQIGLVDQRLGLQGVARALLAQAAERALRGP